MTDAYSGSNSFTLNDGANAFTVTPSFCEVTTTCDNIATESGTYADASNLGCVSFEPDVSDVVTLNFAENVDYVNGAVPPGTYRFTYQVTTDSSVAALTKTVYFDLTLTDICANPVISLDPQNLSNYPDFDLTIT